MSTFSTPSLIAAVAALSLLATSSPAKAAAPPGHETLQTANLVTNGWRPALPDDAQEPRPSSKPTTSEDDALTTASINAALTTAVSIAVAAGICLMTGICAFAM